MKKLWMVPVLMFGIGYAIAEDTTPPVDETVIENPAPDEVIQPTQEEPILTDSCAEGLADCSEVPKE